jgi:hypothetical protein
MPLNIMCPCGYSFPVEPENLPNGVAQCPTCCRMIQAVDPQSLKNRSAAKISLILGLIGLVAWFIPLAGLPVTICGLVYGIKGLRSTQRGMAIAGVILSSICLVITLANAALGAYLGITGQHALLNEFKGR